MKNYVSAIEKFLRDERGSESTEVGVTTVVLAGGSAAQLSTLKTTIQGKVTNVVTTLGEVDVN